MKYLVIANPASRRGKAADQIPLIEERLRECALDFDLVQTQKAGHAIQLAAQAATSGYDVVIAAGGDGTINEVVNGLMLARKTEKHQPALGIISIGTGNDLIIGLGQEQGVGPACKLIANNKRRKIDVGHIIADEVPEGRYFANGIGIGFDAAGGILAEKITWPRGFLSYLIAALQNIFLYYTAPTLKIIIDDETIEMPSLLVSVMNGQRVGGGFLTAPDAIIDDGLFDLCIADEVSRPRMLTLLPLFLKGTQIHEPEIQMKRAKGLKITALEGSMPIHTDGEIICMESKEVEIKILPHALKILG
jgi:diacylglycerol kinase (ATP)